MGEQEQGITSVVLSDFFYYTKLASYKRGIWFLHKNISSYLYLESCALPWAQRNLKTVTMGFAKCALKCGQDYQERLYQMTL